MGRHSLSQDIDKIVNEAMHIPTISKSRGFFGSKVMHKVGAYFVQHVKERMTQGYIQIPERDVYRSEEYKRRKARGMRDIHGVPYKMPGYKRKRYGTIRSTRTSSVDMILTGELYDSIKVQKAVTDRVIINYKGSDKILRNEKWGRNIRNLDRAGRAEVLAILAKNFALSGNRNFYIIIGE
jgi:hypothetical protein